jgi:alkylation response protein AidB-like acyl-CoA dehydrogenase
MSGQKMWLTNGGFSSLVAVLVRTDGEAEASASVYRKMSTFLVEKPAGFGEVRPGLFVPGKLEKIGYKGVDTTELVMDGLRVPSDTILGEAAGRGLTR